MVTWKAFWATLTVVATGSWAGVAYFTGPPTWLTLAAQAGAGAVFVGCARAVIDAAPMFAQVSDTGREQITRLMSVGAAVHAGWALATLIRPDLWGIWALTLAVIGWVQYWAARGHQYLLTTLRPEARDTSPSTGNVEVDQYTRVLTAALTRAGYSWLSVLKWEPIGAPRAFGIRVWVRMPSRMALSQSGERRQDSGLNSTAAEPVAIGLAEVLNREILSDWVAIKKEPGAGTYTIVIVTEDVMGRVYPWVDDPQWASIKTAKLYGYELDAQPHHLRLDQMGQIAGATRGGKSSLVHVEFAQVSLCHDAVIWVAGTEKLYDLVGGWLEPYMDQDLPLPFDWVASGQTDLLLMLVAALTIARWRQRQPMRARQGFQTIIVYLDEASFALRNTKARATYQGVEYNASQLLGMCTQATGSAEIYFRYISQRGVNSHFGDSGGDTTANAGFAAAFRTKASGDVGRLTGDWKASPRHKGEFILEHGDDPIRLKAPYLQEVDPSKPVLHNGATIADVSWARRPFVRDLDGGSVSVAGDAYRDRHRRMDGDMLAYLTDTTVADADDTEDDVTDTGGDGQWANNAGYQAGQAILAAAGVPTATSGGGVGTAELAPLSMVGRRPRAQRIAAIVEQAQVPLTKDDIAAALRAQGDHASDQVVTNALTKLVNEEVLRRPERGRYAHA